MFMWKRKNLLQKMEILFTLYESKMYAEAYTVLGDVKAAEEVVQEIFIKLSDSFFKTCDLQSDFVKIQILKEVHTAAVNRYRQRQREEWLFEFVDRKEVYSVVHFLNEESTHIFSKEYENAKKEFFASLRDKAEKKSLADRLEAFLENKISVYSR